VIGSKSGRANPVGIYSGKSFMHIVVGGIYVVAVSSQNVDVSLVFVSSTKLLKF